MIEALQEIDSIRLNFNNDGRLFLNLTIAFIMFGIALELKPDDFKKLFRSPKPALVGILSQFLLMPLLTFLLASALGDFITPTIGMGMILVSACPGGKHFKLYKQPSERKRCSFGKFDCIQQPWRALSHPVQFCILGKSLLRIWSKNCGQRTCTIPLGRCR